MFQDKSIPLYYQLETILRKQILSGELSEEDLFPTEETLAKEYGVSRITVRQALASLERDGLLIRKRGKGTFVSDASKRKIYFDPLKFTGSLQDLTGIGVRTEIKVLDFRKINAPLFVTDRLKLPKNMDFIKIERLRLAEGYPYCYILNYVPFDIGNKINPDNLLSRALLKIIEEDFGLYLAKAIQTFEATIADPQVAPLLEVRIGDPLLKIERVVFGINEEPIEFVSILYRADKYLFKIALKREKAHGHLDWKIIQ